MILTIRTTVGRENAVIETLTSKIKHSGLDIKCLFSPGKLKGYVFIEGDERAIDNVIKAVPHVKGVIRRTVPMAEIKKFLEVKKIDIKINRGDIVEVIGGPFKNEKGKITRVDEAKEEITMELLEAAIPIPITVPIDSVRVLESIEDGDK